MLAPEANAFQRSREVWGYQGQRQDISRDKNYAKQKTFFCCDRAPYADTAVSSVGNDDSLRDLTPDKARGTCLRGLFG